MSLLEFEWIEFALSLSDQGTFYVAHLSPAREENLLL